MEKKKRCEKHNSTLPCIQCEFDGYSKIIKKNDRPKIDWKKSDVLFRYVQLDSKANEFYRKHKDEIEEALHDYEKYKKKIKGKKSCKSCIHYVVQFEYWDNPKCKIGKIPDCPDNNYSNHKAKQVK